MPEITASMVKELRERTGAGMMDCKAALNETGGNLDEAIVVLRKKFGNKAENRAGRAASEGVIAVTVLDSQTGAIVELNAETDFVARSDDFKALAKELAEHVAQSKGHSVETVIDETSLVTPGVTVKSRINEVFTKLRENIVFRRFEFISTDACGVLAAYVHVPANDKIGVLVELEAATEEQAKSEALQNLGKEIAMQIAASRPRYLTEGDVPAALLDQERDIARTQAQNEGRPAAAMEKIVEGRVKKFFEEAVLLNQPYLREPKKTVRQIVSEAGTGVGIRRYVRFEVGEKVAGVETSGDIKEQAE
jgi:elongation factor Ts